MGMGPDDSFGSMRAASTMRKLSTRQIKRLLESDEDVLLVSVVERDAFEAEHIPGSKNIPLGPPGFTLDVMASALDRNKQIVVYCNDRDSDASEIAARKLEKAGYANVWEYEGGTSAWREAGYPVESL